MDQLQKRFPVQHERIKSRRTQDPVFAEICDDIEILIAILETEGSSLEPRAKQNLMDSILGLENEISTAIALDDRSTNSKERNGT